MKVPFQLQLHYSFFIVKLSNYNLFSSFFPPSCPCHHVHCSCLSVITMLLNPMDISQLPSYLTSPHSLFLNILLLSPFFPNIFMKLPGWIFWISACRIFKIYVELFMQHTMRSYGGGERNIISRECSWGNFNHQPRVWSS